MDPFGGGHLSILDGAPRLAEFDQFCLVQTVGRLSHANAIAESFWATRNVEFYDRYIRPQARLTGTASFLAGVALAWFAVAQATGWPAGPPERATLVIFLAWDSAPGFGYSLGPTAQGPRRRDPTPDHSRRRARTRTRGPDTGPRTFRWQTLDSAAAAQQRPGWGLYRKEHRLMIQPRSMRRTQA